MIYIDADTNLETWRHVAEAGDYTHYEGRAARGDVIIRFGCNHGRFQNQYPNGVRVLNPRIVLNKRDQMRALVAANVPVPTWFDTRAEWEAAGRPQVLTKPAIGQMGTGIRLVENPRTFGRANVIQVYIDKQREFRAMMVGGLLAFFMEKHRPANNDIRWNEHRGAEWTRVPEDRTLRNNVKRIGEQALQAMGYDFGAIDIMMDARGYLWVLEVNSRPEFGPVNARRFANAITQYVNGGGDARRRNVRGAEAAAPARGEAQPARRPRRRNRVAPAPTVQEEAPQEAPTEDRPARPHPLQTAERAVDAPLRFCPTCGRQFPATNDWAFCGGCGRELA